VVFILIHAHAEDFITSVVTGVISIKIFTSAKDFIASVVTIVVKVGVNADAEDALEAIFAVIIAIVIKVGILVDTEEFTATVVTTVVKVGILAEVKRSLCLQALFAVSIADMVFVFVYVRFIKFIVIFAEEIALMVKIGILTYAQNFTAQIAFVIAGIEIFARANSFTTSNIVAIMITIIIYAIRN
jgi:hypothetical protein